MVWNVRHCLQGPLQGLSQKGNIILFDQKVKKNKTIIILQIGCWDGGHMTNYQKWSKNESYSPSL